VCECELTNDLETRSLTEWKWHPNSLLITQLLSNLLLGQSTNHIYIMKPHHPKNHKHGSRYKSSRLFKLSPNIQSISSYKGDVRSRYMFTKDSWRNNLKHDDGWLSRCWHVSKKVVWWGLYLNITKELMMRIVWMWID